MVLRGTGTEPAQSGAHAAREGQHSDRVLAVAIGNWWASRQHGGAVVHEVLI